MKRKGQKARGSALVAVPAAVVTKSRSQGPRVSGSRGGGFRVVNTELISTVNMNTSTVVSVGLAAYSVNPGLSGTFPWLSAIGANFQSYRFNSLRFEYKPSCPTTMAGVVCLAFDADPSNDVPTTLPSLYAYRERISGAPYSRLSLSIPPRALGALGKRKFVRTPSTSVNTASLPQFDCGTLLLYLGQGSSSSFTGTFEVHYDVELIEPQPSEANVQVVAVFGDSSSWGKTIPFGNNPIVNPPGYFSITNTLSTTYFTFLRYAVGGASYLCSITLAGSGTVPPVYAITAFGGASLEAMQYAGTSGNSAFVANFEVRVFGPSQGIQMAYSAGFDTSVVFSRVYISLIPDNVD